jgi:hypothetical protein
MHYDELNGMCRVLVAVLSQHLSGRTEATSYCLRKSSVKISSVPSEIRTQHLSNMSLKLFHYINPHEKKSVGISNMYTVDWRRIFHELFKTCLPRECPIGFLFSRSTTNTVGQLVRLFADTFGKPPFSVVSPAFIGSTCATSGRSRPNYEHYSDVRMFPVTEHCELPFEASSGRSSVRPDRTVTNNNANLVTC